MMISLFLNQKDLLEKQKTESLKYQDIILFYRYCLCKCSFKLPELVPLAYSRGMSTRYLHRLHDFSVTNPRFYKNVFVSSFFPHTAGSGISCLQKLFRCTLP